MNHRTLRSYTDVCMIPDVKRDSFKYYEYVLYYVENVLFIFCVPLKTNGGIKAVFKLKGGKA